MPAMMVSGKKPLTNQPILLKATERHNALLLGHHKWPWHWHYTLTDCTKIVLFYYAETILTTEDLSVLTEKLNSVAYKWYSLGIQLGFQPGFLRKIQDPVSDHPSTALPDLLNAWLQRTSPPSTLQSLVDAIGGSIIANQSLAEQILKECEDFPSIESNAKLI